MSIADTEAEQKPKPASRRFLGRLRRDERGVTAVEFGIIAAPFLFLIVALLETAMVHITTLDLENAVKDASRQIRTGQAQTAGLSAAEFRTLLCNKTVLVSDCETTSNLLIDVRSYDEFEANVTDPSELYDENGDWSGSEEYQLGAASKVVVVRAYYKLKLLAQIPQVGLANAGPNHRMLNAVAVFRNEPF